MFSAPEEVLDYIYDILNVQGGELGLLYVAYGDEDKVPKMPAAQVATGVLAREFHATHTFLNTFNIDILVYHGNLKATHAQRSKEDLELCSSIRALLHSDMTLGGNVIQGWVIQESPATIARPKAPAVVGTRMTWQGIAEERF